MLVAAGSEDLGGRAAAGGRLRRPGGDSDPGRQGASREGRGDLPSAGGLFAGRSPRAGDESIRNEARGRIGGWASSARSWSSSTTRRSGRARTPDRRRVAARAAEQRGVRPLHEGAPRRPRYAVTQSVGGDEPAPDETSWTNALALESETRFREDAAGVQAGKRYRRAGRRPLGRRGTPTGAPSRARARRSRGRRRPRTGSSSTRSASWRLRLEPAGGDRGRGPEGQAGARQAASRLGCVGRDVFRVGPGADVVELAIDAERGALLRSEAFLDGEPFHRLEVTDIAFGPIPAETFELALPEGAEPAAGWFRPLRLPLHELRGCRAVPRPGAGPRARRLAPRREPLHARAGAAAGRAAGVPELRRAARARTS